MALPTTLALLKPLLTYSLWSRLSFLLSYLITSLLILEILRLVYTDASKREVEKLLDVYTSRRINRTPDRSHIVKIPVPLEELVVESPPAVQRSRTRTPSPAAAVGPVSERRRRASPLISQKKEEKEKGMERMVETRRLRKRSDTVTSSGSAESRGSIRRRREGSPAEKSRQESPSPMSTTERRARRLEKMLRLKG